MNVKANIEFIDQLKIKMKNVTINDYHVLGRARRREVASKNRYKFILKNVVTLLYINAGCE